MSDDRARNTVLTVGTAVGVGALCWFINLMWSVGPEAQVQALGNVVGGVVGAAATALAVYLTLDHSSRQQERRELRLKKVMLDALIRHANFLGPARWNLSAAVARDEPRTPADIRWMRPSGPIVIDATSRAKFTETFPEAAALVQQYLDACSSLEASISGEGIYAEREGGGKVPVLGVLSSLDLCGSALADALQSGFDVPEDDPKVVEFRRQYMSELPDDLFTRNRPKPAGP